LLEKDIRIQLPRLLFRTSLIVPILQTTTLSKLILFSPSGNRIM